MHVNCVALHRLLCADYWVHSKRPGSSRQPSTSIHSQVNINRHRFAPFARIWRVFRMTHRKWNVCECASVRACVCCERESRESSGHALRYQRIHLTPSIHNTRRGAFRPTKKGTRINDIIISLINVFGFVSIVSNEKSQFYSFRSFFFHCSIPDKSNQCVCVSYGWHARKYVCVRYECVCACNLAPSGQHAARFVYTLPNPFLSHASRKWGSLECTDRIHHFWYSSSGFSWPFHNYASMWLTRRPWKINSWNSVFDIHLLSCDRPLSTNSYISFNALNSYSIFTASKYPIQFPRWQRGVLDYRISWISFNFEFHKYHVFPRERLPAALLAGRILARERYSAPEPLERHTFSLDLRIKHWVLFSVDSVVAVFW